MINQTVKLKNRLSRLGTEVSSQMLQRSSQKSCLGSSFSLSILYTKSNIARRFYADMCNHIEKRGPKSKVGHGRSRKIVTSRNYDPTKIAGDRLKMVTYRGFRAVLYIK